MEEVEYIEIDGKIYVSVVDLVRCVDHIESDIVRSNPTQTTTIGNVFRWLRANLMKTMG